MPIDNKEVKEFEQKYKNVLFEQVGKLSSKQTELLRGIEQMGKYIDLEKDLPNIGITLNNKIIELQHQFEDAGISIYSQTMEDYGAFKLNFIMPSFVGKAIIYDLIENASSGTNKLGDYSKKMDKLTKKRSEKLQSLEQTTPLKKFVAKIKAFFKPVKQEDFDYTKEETDEVNSHLLEFRKFDNKIWKYNLRDNVISSIVKHIREQKYDESQVPGLLEESVYPDLKKLGLEDLIPQLQQSLIEEYKKDREMYSIMEDDMTLNNVPSNTITQDDKEIEI